MLRFMVTNEDAAFEGRVSLLTLYCAEMVD